MNESKKINITFAPGCFDNFDGTQEELDTLISEIKKMADTGELWEKSNSIDIDELLESDDQELAASIIANMNNIDSNRKLQ